MIIPDTALGAIVAALIAAALSLLGLLVSKEQKTSEFRQAWIDALRADIAALIAAMHAIDDGETAGNDDVSIGWKETRSDYLDGNAAMLRIKLRLNWEEDDPKELIRLIDQTETILNGEQSTERSGALMKLEEDIVAIAVKILRAEWKRVKAGELSFQIAKWGALIIAIVASLVLLAKTV